METFLVYSYLYVKQRAETYSSTLKNALVKNWFLNEDKSQKMSEQSYN